MALKLTNRKRSRLRHDADPVGRSRGQSLDLQISLASGYTDSSYNAPAKSPVDTMR